MMRTYRRGLVVASIGVIAVAFVAALHAQKKPLPADVGPGRAAWFDITASNLAQSREFYGSLFGWTFASLEGTDLAVEIMSRGTGIGSLRLAEGKITPFAGVVYIQVDDIQAAVARAKELGGTIAQGFPFNLNDRPGAIGLVLDPAGHPIGLYSRTPMSPKGK